MGKKTQEKMIDLTEEELQALLKRVENNLESGDVEVIKTAFEMLLKLSQSDHPYQL